MTVLGGLQFLFYLLGGFTFRRFNTDDGIRRAAIRKIFVWFLREPGVSIPMTVLGGLQFDMEVKVGGTLKVSIPMTVLGGLQLPTM